MTRGAVGRGEWNKADHLYQWLWNHAPRIEAFDLLLSVAIPKNFNDDHYFMFPGTVWRAFEEGVLDNEFFATVMRPVVRFVTRSPVAPNNPMPSPLPQIEGLIEEHQLLKRIYRQRTGEDESAVIGELGEAISAVDVFSDIPVLMAKALASGISLEGAGEALSIGAAGLFLRSLGGNPMDVHLHTSINLRRYLLRLEGISLRNKLLREPWRWMHLVCGAQAAAISFGENMTVYEEYLELLHAAQPGQRKTRFVSAHGRGFRLSHC